MATLYTGDDVGWPNGMTLHHEERYERITLILFENFLCLVSIFVWWWNSEVLAKFSFFSKKSWRVFRILYWADAKVDKLIAFDLKTNKKSVLLDRQMHPFGLAVWQDHLYWSGEFFKIVRVLVVWEVRSCEKWCHVVMYQIAWFLTTLIRLAAPVCV